MEKKTLLFVFLAFGALAGGGLYFWSTQVDKTTEKPISTAPPATPTPGAVPENHYPVGTTHSGNALVIPSNLDQSDASLENQLFVLFKQKDIEAILELKDLIRKTVVTVMNAQDKSWQLDTLPFKAVPGTFKVIGKNDSPITLDLEKNGKRYEPYLHLLREANLKACVDLYVQFYPLFQSAYREIEAKGDFNDLFVQVIDHLLSTPDPHEPILLTKKNVSYKFVDPNLEDLSVSQKILIRVGPENERFLKEKFHELRNLLTKLNH